MAGQTRETLEHFLLEIVISIQEGADLIDVAEQLERATSIADELASHELADRGMMRMHDFYSRNSDQWKC